MRCPHCGRQPESAPATPSSVCLGCGRPVRARPGPNSTAEAAEPERKRITCFDCAAELEIDASLSSVKCQRCGVLLDLRNYRVYDVASKRIKTKGAFVVEPRGYLYNTEAIVGDAIIKGKFRGNLVAEHSLTIYSSAEIQGTFSAGHFVIPAAQRFHWKERIEVQSAEIAGELRADLRANGTVVLKSTARLFGGVEAQHLAVEEGAVVVGSARVGSFLRF